MVLSVAVQLFTSVGIWDINLCHFYDSSGFQDSKQGHLIVLHYSNAYLFCSNLKLFEVNAPV